MQITNRAQIAPFQTADGSQIRELLNSANSALKNQSLAEATLLPGQATTEHFHPLAEEIYYILRGRGQIRIESEEKRLGAGDCIAIPNGQKHKIWNEGDKDLVFLCCCAPAYSHEDTILSE